MADLKLKFNNAQHDTARIRALFEMGNLFIEGPSDSLIFYYEKALVFIEKNYQEYDPVNDVGSEPFETFRDQKIRAFIEFGIEYFFRGDYTRSLDYYFQALELVKELDDPGLLSECLSEIGIVYKNQGNFDLALEYYDKSLEYARLTNDTSWLASCKVNIGNVYKEKGFLTQALNFYMDALKILEGLQHDRRISACYQNIGNIYHKQHDFHKALDYYSNALAIAIRTNDKVRETTCYLHIGYVYSDLKQFPLARDYYNKAIVFYRESGYSHELDDCYILFGDSYFGERDFSKALDYYVQALDISTMEDDLSRQAEVLGKLGQVYKQRKEYAKSLEYSQRSYDLASKVGSMDLIISSLLNVSEIYEATGHKQKALDAYKEYSQYKDSLFSTDKYKAITEMEIKYESEKKEQQLALLEERTQVQQLILSRRNRIFLVSWLVLGFFIILGYILFRNQRLKTKHKGVELEQKLMRSQMNPHFIFNSLIAIQSFIYKKEAVIAGDYLAKFADLIRITLDNSRVEYVPLDKEVKMLSVYLDLQSLRFEDKFEYSIDVDSNVESSKLMIPPMMAQPFIENAIEHGLMFKKSKGFIRIVFKKENGYFSCLVEDDGIGRKKAKEFRKKQKHQSMATSITADRLKILSKKGRQNYLMQITDLQNERGEGAGTKVIFTIPYRVTEV